MHALLLLHNHIRLDPHPRRSGVLLTMGTCSLFGRRVSLLETDGGMF